MGNDSEKVNVCNDKRSLPIGVMDSGMGGISTLRALVSELPHENFIYFGDDKNAPYGEKSREEVIALSESVVLTLLENGVKAIVVACNTATGAAAAYLREKYNTIPIIGAEPAIKPAVGYKPSSRVLVMATPLTLSSEKFRNLKADFDGNAEIIGLPCVGLVELVESGVIDGETVERTLHDILDPYVGCVDSVVLGCTHYPFLAPVISRVLGDDVPLFDGNRGIAAETHRRLSATDLLCDRTDVGQVEFLTSSGDPTTPVVANMLLNL